MKTRLFRYLQISILVVSGLCFMHPYFVSVADLKYNAKSKTIEAAVKININDFEQALHKLYDKKVDLINSHGKDREDLNKLISEYLGERFHLKCNGKDQKFDLMGFEREEEAIWVYLEFKNCETPKKVDIQNSILYDYLNHQENLIHFDLNGKKKSSKVSYPEKDLHFEF